jgi:hypothetical protein
MISSLVHPARSSAGTIQGAFAERNAWMQYPGAMPGATSRSGQIAG